MSDDALIDLIYDASYDEGIWASVLAELADRSGAYPANMLELNVLDGHGDGVCVRTPPDIMQTYSADWAGANTMLLVDDLADYSAAWTPGILRDSDWIDRDRFERSAYLNEFLDPIEAAHNLTMRLSLVGPWLTTVGFGRPRRRGPFEDRDIAAIRPFHAHIVRACRLRRALGLRQEQLDQFDTLLAGTPQALFFLDDDLKVTRLTAAAEALAQKGAVLRVDHGRLHAVAPAADHVLGAALRAAFIAGAPPEPLVLTGIRPHSRLTLEISRIGERATARFSSARCLLVAVSQAAPLRSPPEQLLRERFGLTAAEARLALNLSAGASLKTLSERNAVSIHTLRNQLKAVFHKIGCNRQQELARIVANYLLIAGEEHQ